MNTTSSSIPSGRALVLGGGGSTGHAWVVGVVAGLLDGGLDVTTADRVVGTSSGSTVAAQITNGDPRRLHAASLVAPPGSPRRGSRRQVAEHLERARRRVAEAASADDLRRRTAATALARAADLGDEASARWRETVAARLSGATWPRHDLRITAVDAETAEPVVFDRDSGVDLVDAVAASCAGGFAYALGGRHYIDGGHRTNAENADVAAGCARVLVLSPLGGRSWTPVDWGLHLSTQLEELRSAGSAVELVVPPPEAEHLFGADAMDPGLRPVAARTGHEQGSALAGRLTTFWGAR